MTQEHAAAMLDRLDKIEANVILLIKERDQWKSMYFELKESADKLLEAYYENYPR